jgi:hypothetical protein
MTPKKPSSKKQLPSTGITLIDGLANLPQNECTLETYVKAASEYVRRSRELGPGPKKAGQIRLSNALARAFLTSLNPKLPELKNAFAGERMISGALRSVSADVSEIHPTDGLRLAVELKPVNLAVGRAIWNRFGDIRTFAVNVLLKFPFCVVGAVLTVPTYEESGTPDAAEAMEKESAVAMEPDEDPNALTEETPIPARGTGARKSTLHLVERAIARLVRAGGRETEGDAPHLLEGIAVVVYDPDKGRIEENIPPAGSSLRWSEFVEMMAAAYRGRFEDI